MTPKTFNGCNVVFGKDQPEYQPLPAQVSDDRVITCWQFTDEEIERIIKNKCMYIQQMTFGAPLQPLLPVVEIGDDLTLNPL